MTGDTNARGEAIEAFVARLAQVRADSGDPSFREMAKRSGAISHATLHDALQGARMPSWETTVEFAKACGADPDELREEWEQAAAIVWADREVCPSETDESEDVEAVEEATTESEPSSPRGALSPPAEEPRQKRPLIALGAAAALLLVAVVLGGLLLTRESPSDDAESTSTVTGEAAAAYSSAPDAPSTTTGAQGCPVNEEVAPGTERLMAGDESEFVDDVTVPDCSVQKRNTTVVKTWELKNAGTVKWENRFLHRINVHEGSSECHAPERVAIPETEPGETVEVSVTITTPEESATCFGRWMQTDSDGNFTFPEQRPYYYTFRVR